jgi:spermidine/putrescine transport system substrate-binding protein
MLDDERESVGAALQYLGYSVNSTSADELTQARDLLLQQKPLLARYDSESVSQGLASGEIVLAHAWNGAASLAKEENPDIEWILPEDGGVIWQDTLAIPADAPNAYAAHVFINNVLDGVIGARITDYTYFLTPNLAAEPLVSEDVRDLIYYPDDEMRERLEYIERRGDPALYSDIWTQVKGG